ncbi:hypothetical protein C0J52_08549 [Blattella germanica]|nr:hypothetical protein C0J52_08549 [Blattella germanica]
MKAKKLMTTVEDGVEDTPSEAPLQKWGSLEDQTSKTENLIYGNPSFLSRFIELNNDNKLPCGMTGEIPEAPVDSGEQCKITAANVDQGDSSTADKLSRTDKEKNAVLSKSDQSLKQNGSKVPPSIRRVEEIRRRIESGVVSPKPAKDSIKNGVPRVKKIETSKSKFGQETKEDNNKPELRRGTSRDSPPRRVSFKVRSGINSSRSSSSSSRRSTNGKAFVDVKATNLSSSKVAALASKFNAIIEKDGKKAETTKMEPKPPTKTVSTTLKTVDKTPVSRRTSNSKKENGTNSSKMTPSTVASKRVVKQPLSEEAESSKFPSAKDNRRKVNLGYRPSVVGTKSGNVKAAIQIFEKNSLAVPSSAKINPPKDSGKPEQSSTAKKEPKYPRVIFKREATLVRVTLECEDVCNEDAASKSTTKHESIKAEAISYNNETEAKTDKELRVEQKNARNSASEFSDVHQSASVQQKEIKTVKAKPPLPAKTVIKGEPEKSSTDDNNYVKVMCKSDSAYESISKESDQHKTESFTNKVYEITNFAQQKDSSPITPNKSFLWGVSPPSSKPRTSEEQPITYTAVPAIVTKDYDDAQKETTNDDSFIDDTYDDIYVSSTGYTTNGSQQLYSVIDQPDDDDDLYDDVGNPSEDAKTAPKTSASKTMASNSTTDGDGNDSGYDYCGGPVETTLDETYDDCEGEGYQCIGEGNEDAESNIYDDVNALTTLRMAADDVTSISNCYESIYSGGGRMGPGGGATPGDTSAMRTGVSSSASSSIGSGNQSFCDQSNSLYGIGGSKFDSASVSQASTDATEERDAGRVRGDHGRCGSHGPNPPGKRPATPKAKMSNCFCNDTRKHLSFGWELGKRNFFFKEMHVALSDDQFIIIYYRVHHSCAYNCVFVTSSSVLYLGDPEPPALPRDYPRHSSSDSEGLVSLRAILYIGDAHESQEMTFFLEKEGGDNSSDSEGNNHHYEILYEVVNSNRSEIPYDDFDSFDSDVSDETYIKPLHQAGYDIGNGQLPEPPPGQNIYGISKIAEAGKKMLKLGKSLRKMRNKRNSSTAEAGPPLPTTPRPAPPSLPSRPVPPPRISEKSVSSSNLSGRKYWSLRKFKRSASATDQMPSTSAVNGSRKETATFYLTHSLDADTGDVGTNSVHRKSVDGGEACTENGDTPTSLSSAANSKTVVYDLGAELNEKLQRHSATSKKQRPASAPERRGSGNIRPNSPPPLPPQPANLSSDNPKRPARKEKRNSGSTSWYAECGLFDQSTENNSVEMPKRNVVKQERPPSNSWYAEVGLWDMSTSSPNDSSLSEQDARSQQTDLSGGDSSVSATSPENSGVVERRFADEPLYQFYNASLVERIIRAELSDGYEEIGDGNRKQPARPTAMELIQPREGQHRTLWCEIPEVVNSHILSTISTHQKKLQEAKFEVITSEASYVNSLHVLEKHFLSSPELSDESVLSKIKTCSERFLADLEECWQDNILLHGICEVIYKHANKHFNVYIKYCSNQIHLDRTLRRLKDQHGKFSEVLAQLESSSICQALSLHSFLMLPMQRITRLPLLIDAILTRLDPQDSEYDTCRMALATVNKMTSTEGMSHLPIKYKADGGSNLMLLTMLQNHENKTVEMILSCPLESDRQRWLEAVSPPVSENPNETLYEEWDCPQVRAIHSYVAHQPDELSLAVGDVVNVLRKTTDGWYQGERIRDGERGWFPANHTVEIISSHVRARNLKQRYRLLALSGNFLESQRKEKQAKS